MIKFSKSTFFIIAFQFFCSILLSQDNKKLAQTGFQFLSVTSDARAAGMGNAVTATGLGSSSLFFNPAGLALMNSKMDLSFSTNSWIADISHNSFSFGLYSSLLSASIVLTSLCAIIKLREEPSRNGGTPRSSNLAMVDGASFA